VKALITGVCGQDGHYLSELLLSKGYEVIGTRRGNEEQAETPSGIEIVYGDINDAASMRDLMSVHMPDEVYNLAAVTHVGDSFGSVAATMQTNAVGASNVLDAAFRIGAKFYQASTSELFGSSPPPQSELTPLQPQSPYGVAKLAAFWMVRNYRQRGMHATNGILFNHESPRRGGGFVTQKVCRAVADIHRGKAKCVTLGNLDATRDWGHAKDYCRGMWMLMQHAPDDYVLATGETRTIRELCDVAFRYVGLDYRDFVKTDPKFYRPLEVHALRGDASKALALGWKPEITFEQMIHEMVEAAL
jgi:GDPmannose 4,6-dehydratase